MKVRQSSLKQFGNCARSYYYSHILGLGQSQSGSLTVLGTVWHYAVDVYENYDHDLDLAKRTFVHYWENPDQLGERIDFWHRGTTHKGLRKRGLAMLDSYHELAPWRKGKLLGTEIRFEVPIGDHILQGTIDKLWYRPGQKKIEVIDFKTGSVVPEKLRYNIQFTAYCYATETSRVLGVRARLRGRLRTVLRVGTERLVVSRPQQQDVQLLGSGERSTISACCWPSTRWTTPFRRTFSPSTFGGIRVGGVHSQRKYVGRRCGPQERMNDEYQRLR